MLYILVNLNTIVDICFVAIKNIQVMFCNEVCNLTKPNRTNSKVLNGNCLWIIILGKKYGNIFYAMAYSIMASMKIFM